MRTVRLVQLQGDEGQRRLARVEEPNLRLLRRYRSVYECAWQALAESVAMTTLIDDDVSHQLVDYSQIWSGDSRWRILPAFDHPTEPARCLVSGTGLTHLASVATRQAMHEQASGDEENLTDSMRMYQWGVEGGKPAGDRIGVQPERFYKGNGSVLCGHLDPLPVSSFSDDGGEEPEIAGVYIIGPAGQVCRVGLSIGNEFSDHKMEKKNYLYLAPSKLRPCATGPELVIGAAFDDLEGMVSILKDGATVWSTQIKTGEANMSHSLKNLEHHHFKYPAHRQAGDVHVHFFGSGAFSFGAGLTLEEDAVMSIAYEGFGRPLHNPLHIDQAPDQRVEVTPL